ncbi:chaperone modulator CbpM [Echinicola marina]|uniref:chaperone modulator CbpM n=1 Tax=Echinicola marina TaxID=2859768 RepID=UPI001CF6B78F|nr:chaperone modulator CbpM [Echinicola marina]UCS95514.1 chaperone modulator CbpM [Echinicola marina]
MIPEGYISIERLSSLYKVRLTFFEELDDYGLIRFQTLEHLRCVHEDEIKKIEIIIRLHHELEINTPGIETILHLLKKVENLQEELQRIQNRLDLYED